MPDNTSQTDKTTKETTAEFPPIRSEKLLEGRREVQIVHGNEVYRLLLTRNGKLILQK